MKDDMRARVRGLGNKTWKGCDLVELLVIQACLTGSGIIFLKLLTHIMRSVSYEYDLCIVAPLPCIGPLREFRSPRAKVKDKAPASEASRNFSGSRN